MHMIRRNRALDNLNVIRQTNLTYQVTQSQADLPAEDTLAILRHPNEVVLQIIPRMRPCPVILHVRDCNRSRLTEEPKGFA